MDAEHEPNLEGLKKLEEGMRRLEKERVLVPGKIDDDLLGAVRQHFVNEGIAEIQPVAENEILFPAKHAKGKRRKVSCNTSSASSRSPQNRNAMFTTQSRCRK